MAVQIPSGFVWIWVFASWKFEEMETKLCFAEVRGYGIQASLNLQSKEIRQDFLNNSSFLECVSKSINPSERRRNMQIWR